MGVWVTGNYNRPKTMELNKAPSSPKKEEIRNTTMEIPSKMVWTTSRNKYMPHLFAGKKHKKTHCPLLNRTEESLGPASSNTERMLLAGRNGQFERHPIPSHANSGEPIEVDGRGGHREVKGCSVRCWLQSHWVASGRSASRLQSPSDECRHSPCPTTRHTHTTRHTREADRTQDLSRGQSRCAGPRGV